MKKLHLIIPIEEPVDMDFLLDYLKVVVNCELSDKKIRMLQKWRYLVIGTDPQNFTTYKREGVIHAESFREAVIQASALGDRIVRLENV